MLGVLLLLYGAATLAMLSPPMLLVILLSVAPLKVLIATEAPTAIPADVGQIVLALFVAVWLVNRVRAVYPSRLYLSPVLIPVGMFALFSGLTAISAISLSSWLTEWIKWLQIILLIVIVSDMCQHLRWHWVVFAVICAAAANGLIGIYEFFGGSGALHLLVNQRYFRAFGTFGQPNPFGGFMGLVAPLAIMSVYAQAIMIYSEWRKKHLISIQHVSIFVFYALCVGVIVFGLFASYSRGAWLGFAASMGILTLSLPRKLWHSLTLSVSALVILTTGFYLDLIPATIINRLRTITDAFSINIDVRNVDITSANYAVVERLAHWQAAVRMGEGNPWLGVGLGNYVDGYREYSLINWDLPLGHAHNYYLNTLAETGILGLIFYGAMWTTIILMTWQVRQHPDKAARAIAVGLLGTWVYLIVHSLTDNLYVNNMFIHLGVILGLLATLQRQATSFRSYLS